MPRFVYPFKVPALNVTIAQRSAQPRATFRVTTADEVKQNEDTAKPVQSEHIAPAFFLEETEKSQRDANGVGEQAATEAPMESSEDL